MYDELLLVDDKLVLIRDKGNILLYNFGAHEIKNLQLRNLPDSVFLPHVITYGESLVSVTGGNVFKS